MDLELSGRCALVTGAGSGIGLASVRALRAEGALVAAADLDPAAAAGDGVALLEVDLSVEGGPQSAVAFTIEQFGAIDVLVNNVGVCPHRDGFLSVSDRDWRDLFELNFFSMVRCCRSAIPAMLEHGRGSIISLSSDAGHMPGPFFVDYALTKGMIRLLSKALASEFAARGIRSNTISPGPTRTAPWESGEFIDEMAARWGIDREAAIERFVRDVRGMPLGRLGAPEDVAAMIVFLASDRARQVTGADYRVDGGMVSTV
ncbi:MAG TPA: SDR family oxidoreductase [Solirubrobacteraceae bacterium]|jgi:NAD(P)-dependent dehydrogenase (short-subunit alcohol dehydrogenase family)|nr:SDR family oxidoreductase [Solirubrobacteraceae bacterium]